MKIGIVGHEAKKFTPETEAKAKAFILAVLDRPHVSAVVSGHCHLGGIDLWAEEIGRTLGKEVLSFPPANLQWSTGYKPRNLQIAHACDACLCIVVAKLPGNYTGMTFDLCYHCARAGRDGKDHVKSGGCWTVLEAMKLGKPGHWKIVT